MPEGSSSIEQEPTQEDLAERINKEVLRVFPQFSDMDRARYDTYTEADLDDLNTPGRIIRFFTNEVRDNSVPVIEFVLRRKGFMLNINNSPDTPANQNRIRNRNDSFGNPHGRRWREDEIDLALTRAQIRMDGVNLNDETFQSQLVGWSEDENRYITMQEAIEDRAIKSAKKRKYRSGLDLDYNNAMGLVSARLNRPVEEIDNKTLKQELNLLDAQISLLSEAGRNILPKSGYLRLVTPAEL